MSTPSHVDCPFLALCERDFVGPALEPDEQERLEAHLSGGCPACEALVEEQLTGSGGGDPALAASVAALVERVDAAVEYAGQTMEGSRLAVLERVRESIDHEHGRSRRLVRRRLLRVLFYVINVAAVFLLAVAYLGTRMAIRWQQVSAQRLQTQTEALALAGALARYVQDHELEAKDLPADLPALVAVLRRPRKDGERPYYPFEPARLDEAAGAYLDGFGRPYRYLARGGRALVYSLGPDGKDAQGEQDDLGRWVYFARP